MDRDQRQCHQRRGHERRLDQVAPGHRLEAAEARVEEDDDRAENDSGLVGNPEERLEGLARSGELGGHVGPRHHQDHHRPQDAEDLPPVPKPLLHPVGHRDGAVAVGERLEAGADEGPRDRGGQHLPEDDPERVHPQQVAHPGEPEEQPGALAGARRGEADDRGGELPARQVVAGEVAGAAGAPDRQPEEDREVADQHRPRGASWRACQTVSFRPSAAPGGVPDRRAPSRAPLATNEQNPGGCRETRSTDASPFGRMGRSSERNISSWSHG